MLFNKSQFKVANNKKLLRKIGKKWVTVSALTLVLLGGGALISSATTHADTTIPAVEAKETNNVKKQINSNLDKAYQMKNNAQSGKGVNEPSASSSSVSSSASQNNVAKPSNIQSKATNMYRGLMLNAANNSNRSSSSSTSSASATSAKSSMAGSNSVSASAKPSFNSAYQSYMAQMSGVDNEVANANDSNVKNSNNNNNQNKPAIKHNLGDSNNYSQYFTGATHTGTDCGLNYTAYANGGVEITGGTANDDLDDFTCDINSLEPVNQDMTNATAIKFDDNINISHISNTTYMFLECPSLQFIDFGNNFDTSHLGNTMMYLTFDSDRVLNTIRFGNKFDTRQAADTTDMFSQDTQPQCLYIQSPNTRIGGVEPRSPYYKELPTKDSNGNPYTQITPTDLSKGNNVGTFTVVKNPGPITDKINYQYDGKTVGSQEISDKYHLSDASDHSDHYDWTNLDIFNGFNGNNYLMNFLDTDTYHLVNPHNEITPNGGTYNIPVYPNTETDTVNYSDNGKRTSSTISGNYASDAKSEIDNNVPNNYHAVNGDTGTFTPNGTFNVQIAPNQATDEINYTYNNKTIGTSSVKGDTAAIQSDKNNSIDITPANATNVPPYYHLANNKNQVSFDGKPKNIAVTPDQATDKINYTYNGHSLSNTTITGNNSNAKNASDTSDTITPNNLPAELPNGYQLVNTSNKIPYDGEPHAIAIEPTPSYFNVIEYTDSKGNPIGDTTAYGQKGTNIPNSIIENDIPKGYQVTQPLPVKFTDKNVVKVAVQSDNGKGDMVVGTAYLTLLYKKGNRTDGQVLRLHINGNIGDSDIVINPQDYDRDGYSIAPSDKDWHILFDYKDVKHATNDFSRYNVENTFTYQANQIPIDITYFDTQTNNRLSSDNLGKIAYDGDTADLQGTNSDNNVLSVDGNEYHLNLPSGYHLAHANNYIKVTTNGTYVKKESNGVGGFRMLRMPLMKLTLGIIPHFNKHNTKPASTSSVTPVKPSSASSVAPSSASSVQSSSASTVPSSVAPSSASQSTASIIPIVLPSSEASSTSQPSSVAPASEATKPSSASASLASNVATKPVIKPTVHKNNHSEARLNHSISKATHQLSTVERRMKARKATETKMVKKLVHAKKTIKRSQHKLTYLRHNKRHVAHALRRITRNKVAIKHAKKVICTVKAHRAKRVTESKVTNAKPVVKSIKNSVNTPKASSANQSTITKKLPQTGEASHAGLIASILMMASAILAGFGKLFDRKRTE